jgi:ABC-2 type transport system permease protein
VNRVSGNMGRILGLTSKNLKISFRDRGNYFWVFGYPMIFVLIFAVAFNSGGSERSTYSIAIINEDIQDANNVLEKDASLIFEDLFNGTLNPNGDLPKTFIRYTQWENGSIITKNEAIRLVEQGKLDAVLVIPKNFTECIIGSTWWYKQIKSDGFDSLPQEVKTGIMTQMPPTYMQAILDNSSSIPLNQSVEIEIYTKADPVTKAIMNAVFEGITNDIILAFNDIQPLKVNTSVAGISKSFTIFEWSVPGFLIVGVTIAIMMVAQNFGLEKEKGLLKRLDTTPVPRSAVLASGAFAQIIFSSIQTVILFGMVTLVGYRPADTANWGLAFLNSIIMTIPCIGIGLIIASLIKNASDAGGLSWIAILPLQFLGNGFFYLGEEGIVRLVPTFYGIRAMQNILLRGWTFAEVLPDMLITLLFGIGLILIGFIIFSKKTQI